MAEPAGPDFLPALTGSFSTPAVDNPTVVMVEAAYRHHGIAARYINCEVSAAKLGDAVRGARAMGWLGFNCSLPHKVEVIAHLDRLGESAALIGAVNTVVRRGDALVGENTDGRGFVAALQPVADLTGKRVVIFGAGGAARAVAVEMALAGVGHLVIVNRSVERAKPLVDLLNARTRTAAELVAWSRPYSVPADTDIVINVTSVGLPPDAGARLNLDVASLAPHMIVADAIPNPPRTSLLRDASARGCRTVDGLGMLVNQGVVAIRHWTGVDPDPVVMRRAIEDALHLTP